MPGCGETTPYTYPYTGSIAVRRENGYVVSGTNRYTSVPSAHTGPGSNPNNGPRPRTNYHLYDGMRPNISAPTRIMTAYDTVKTLSTSPSLARKVYINDQGENEYEEKVHQQGGYPMLVRATRAKIVNVTKKSENNSQAEDSTENSFVLVSHADTKPAEDGADSDDDDYVNVNSADDDYVEIAAADDDFVDVAAAEDFGTDECFVLVTEEEDKPDVTVQ